MISVQFSSIQSLSRVQLFATPWIAPRQTSLSITNSRNLHKLMPIELVMPSSHLILCRPLLLLPPIPPSIRVFSNESIFAWGGQSIGVSASASVHLVKAMAFPVVIYGCESWAAKKAERRKTDAFELWCWRRLLTVPWTARRSNQSIL